MFGKTRALPGLDRLDAIDFSIVSEADQIKELMLKYHDLPMSRGPTLLFGVSHSDPVFAATTRFFQPAMATGQSIVN